MRRTRLAILAAAFLLTSTAVDSQVVYGPTQLDPASYNPRNLPVVQTPTNVMKNVTGMTAEKACLRSGRAQAICGAIGVGVGGAGLMALTDASWSDIAKAAGSAASGALSGALQGCAGGAAIGLIGDGVGAIPGCGIGALAGAISGGFAGAQTGLMNLTADGSVQVDKSNGQVTGSGVQTSAASTVTTPFSGSQIHYGVWQWTASNDPAVPATFASVGYYRGFPCDDGQRYYTCIFLPTTSYGDATAYNGSLKMPSGDQYFWNNPSMQFAPGSWKRDGYIDNANPNDFTFKAYEQAYTWSQLDTPNAILTTLWVQNQGYSSASQVPQMSYSPMPPVPVAASGFAPNVKPENLTKPLSADAIAAIVNAALAKYAQRTGQNLSDISVNNDDVNYVTNNYPQAQPQLQDLYRPIADPAGPGGTMEQPVSNPQQVIVTNPQSSPGTGTGSSAGTTDKPDQDLDSTAGGTLGNPIQPILDFLAGPLKPFLHPQIDGVQGQCPVWTVDFRDNVGQLLHKDLYGNATENTAVHQWAETFLVWKSDSVCGFLDDHYSQVQLFCSIALLIASFYWFFE